MTQLCWWLVEKLSRLLEPDERDAALGDFAESGIGGGTALRDLLGLVARRQAAQWKDWRPWLALVGIVGSVSVMLLYFSLYLSGTFELYFWIIANYRHFDPVMLEQTGLTVRHGVAVMVRHTFLLLSWSWTAGFVLGSLSRRTIWVNGVLLCCVAGLFLFGTMSAVAPPTPPRLLLLSALLTLLPFIWGARQGLRLGTLRRRPAILLATAVVATTVYAISVGGWWPPGTWQPIQLIVSLILCWPVGYIVATAVRCRWRGKDTELA